MATSRPSFKIHPEGPDYVRAGTGAPGTEACVVAVDVPMTWRGEPDGEPMLRRCNVPARPDGHPFSEPGRGVSIILPGPFWVKDLDGNPHDIGGYAIMLTDEEADLGYGDGEGFEPEHPMYAADGLYWRVRVAVSDTHLAPVTADAVRTDCATGEAEPPVVRFETLWLAKNYAKPYLVMRPHTPEENAAIREQMIRAAEEKTLRGRLRKAIFGRRQP